MYIGKSDKALLLYALLEIELGSGMVPLEQTKKL